MRKRVLNVGGNNKQIPLPALYTGWEQILLDIDPLGSPDIVADARNLFHLPRGSFDAVYCSHNLEHYLRHHASKVLSGFWHLVKPEGFVEIRVPDLIEVMERLLRNQLDIDSVLYRLEGGAPILVHDVLYGYGLQMEVSSEEFYNHRCGFSQGSLRRFLHGHGFPWVADGRGNLEARAFAFRNKPAAGVLKAMGLDKLTLSESRKDAGLHELEARAARLWDAGEYAPAAAMCEILLQSGTESPEIFLLLGESALQNESFETSAEMFRKAASADPDSLQAHIGYVRAMTGLGKKKAAAAYVKKLDAQDSMLAELIRALL